MDDHVGDASERRSTDELLSQLAAIVEGSDDAIFSQDAAGRITSWNRGAERLYGYAAEDVLGKPAPPLAPSDDAGSEASIFERVMGGERVERLETQHRRRDRLDVDVSLTVSPILDGAGRVIGSASTARDITEAMVAQTTLAASEERLHEEEALAHVGSWSYDVQTGAVQWSAELHRILDVDPLKFDGTLASHLARVHPADRSAIANAIEKAIDPGEPFEVRHRIVRAHGETRHAHTRGAAVRGAAAAVVGVRGIMQDVSEQHQASEAMRAAYERERVAAEDLRVAAAMKDDFLSIVSHELRTPLTSIVGFAALLEQVDDLDLPDVARRISSNAAEMQRMVERLLDFSRLQSGAVHIELADLALRHELHDASRLLDLVLDGRDLLVDVPDDIVVTADRDALSHVLTNLLSNAAKFSPPGTPIELRAQRTGNEAVVSVTDRGIGIDHGVSDKVFEQFFQATPSPAGRRGTGVGLSIVKSYVELQGGRVWCQSTPGQGSTFLFTLRAVTPAVTP